MVDFRTLIELQGQIFLLVLAGVFFRRKLVGEEFQRDFSTLMVDLILPCNILSSFQIELTRDMAGRTLQIFAISLAGQILALVLGKILFKNMDPDRRAVMKYTLICSNASFLGIPIAGGIWGAEGVLLASVFLIPQRIVMWTVGLSWFSGGGGKGSVKKLFSNTCMIAVFLGLALMLTGLRLPGALRSAVESISRCTSLIILVFVFHQVPLKDGGRQLREFQPFFRGCICRYNSCCTLGPFMVVYHLCHCCGDTASDTAILTVYRALQIIRCSLIPLTCQ